MGDNLREICNGALLPRFTGKKVSVVGLVTQVNPNGLTFDMRTTDDVVVKVNFKKPFMNALEGYVEVQGVAQSKTIICDEIVQFPTEGSKDFDVISHNTLCNMLHVIPDIYKTQA